MTSPDGLSVLEKLKLRLWGGRNDQHKKVVVESRSSVLQITVGESRFIERGDITKVGSPDSAVGGSYPRRFWKLLREVSKLCADSCTRTLSLRRARAEDASGGGERGSSETSTS